MQKAHRVRMHVRRVKGKKVLVKAHTSSHKLKFYDLKARKSFETDKYRIVNKSGRRFAVATAPGGNESWHIMAKA